MRIIWVLGTILLMVGWVVLPVALVERSCRNLRIGAIVMLLGVAALLS